ncbi:MAG: hypothetical protein ACI4PF_03790 [Christensenellales bacterium]
MKAKVDLIMVNTDGTRYKKNIIGNKHTLKLCTGEKLKVVAHKEDGYNYWHITDIETGLNMVPEHYYGFIDYDDKHNAFTEKNALETAKYSIDKHLNKKKITFSEMREKRLKEVQNEKV